LLGVQKQVVSSVSMNLLGIKIVCVSLLVFTQARDRTSEPIADVQTGAEDVKGERKKDASEDLEANRESEEASIPDSQVASHGGESVDVAASHAQGGDEGRNVKQEHEAESPEVQTMGHFVPGFAMALFAGCCFGTTFDPAIHLSQVEGRQQINYLWSSLVGILLSSTVIFLSYILWRGESSYIPRALVLPGMLSGALWAMAQTAWFEANQVLTLAVAFPVVCSMTPLVSLVVGICLFGELKTTRGRAFASFGMLVRAVGIVLIALSC